MSQAHSHPWHIQSPSAFQAWLQDRWCQHKEEAELWGDTACATPDEYWHRYQDWLLQEWHQHR